MANKWVVAIIRDKIVIREDGFEDYYKAKKFFEDQVKALPHQANARIKLQDNSGTTFMQDFVSL